MTLLEKELEERRTALFRSNQHMAFLQDYVRHLEETSEQALEPSKAERPTAKRSESSPGEKITKGQGAVNIEDLAIQKQGSRMLVNFKLVNMQPGDSTVGGYLHILARGNNRIPQKSGHTLGGKWSMGFPRTTAAGRCSRSRDSSPFRVGSIWVRAWNPLPRLGCWFMTSPVRSSCRETSR